jgi:hypothetical protein
VKEKLETIFSGLCGLDIKQELRTSTLKLHVGVNLESSGNS